MSKKYDNIKRHILGVYEGDKFNSLLYQMVELPLNYLGFIVDYFKLDKSLPDDRFMSKYFGIVSFPTNNKGYKKWIKKQIKKGVKVIELDNKIIKKKRGKKRWKFNPLKFFENSLDVKNLPKPDLSILNRNRIFFSNIDGDFFSKVSELGKYNAQIIHNEIFKKYNLPFTASIVVIEIEGKKELENIAKNIFLLDNIEIASHSYSHPHDWVEGKLSGYYDYSIFDLDKEIDYSVGYLNRLINKKVRVFLWPGLANPDERSLRKIYKLKILNFNGGFIFKNNDPLCFLSPYVNKFGNYMQFNWRGANENSFVKHGKNFSEVIDVFKSTDNLSFTLPINLYFHWYSAGSRYDLDELKKILRWVSEQEITPIFTSEFIKMVEDFLFLEIYREKDNWIIKNKGFLKTIRFDDCEKHVNFDKSKNVIGYCHRKNNLYVYLDNDKRHNIALQDSKPGKIFIKNANVVIENWAYENNKIKFQVRGFGVAKFNINVTKDNKYKVLYDNKIMTVKSENKELKFEVNLKKAKYIEISEC